MAGVPAGDRDRSEGDGTRPFGTSATTWTIAGLAVETGIAPSLLLAESPRMLYTMLRYIKHRNDEQAKAHRRSR
jgi:hypothetical protein